MPTARRTRLSPHDRRMQLLDCAQTIILERGLSSFTMEALAREAGVSNPLVYKYFDTRLAILQELLVRETKRFNTHLQAQVTDAQDYLELINLVVSVNFEQFSRNNIVYILRDQPDVFEAIAVDDRKQSGVLERFPRLKVGIIELGANWVPTSLMNLDMGVSLLGKFDQNLKKLTMKPSEYFQRQIRVAPLHTEDTGWILKNVGKDILMFNTDYPHPEGGSDPFGDYERSLDAVNATAEELDSFYSKNYEHYLGL